mmetsp:Transcript_5856/g.7499  ORF Transcript_5856/g.7499 Transcript_5856/m.7499 type:complete len:243 (+) Transcript_5856:82-810(+)
MEVRMCVCKIDTTWRRCSIAPARAAPKEVDGRVVHEVPDDPANHAVCALVDLGGLNDLFLDRTGSAPDTSVAGTLLPVCANDKARIVGPKGRRKHASTPWPVHDVRLERVAKEVLRLVAVHEPVNLDDVLAGNHGLLLTWVGDLGDGRDRPGVRRRVWCWDTTVVAVAHRIDPRIALLVSRPDFTLARFHGQRHVHKDPATAAGALLTEGLLGHEVIRGLDADADVLLVRLLWQSDLVPEAT